MTVLQNFSQALSCGDNTLAHQLLNQIPFGTAITLCIIHDNGSMLSDIIHHHPPPPPAVLLASQRSASLLSLLLQHTPPPPDAMHAAVYAGNQACVEVLLKHGACLEVGGGDGATPLMVAILGGDEAIVRLLVTAGGNVRGRWRGRYVWEWARGVGGGVWAVVRELIDSELIDTGEDGREGGLLKADVSVGAETIDCP